MKDTLLALAIIGCCIGVLIVYFNFKTKKSAEKILYFNPLSPEFQKNMDYISNASLEASDSLPDGWSGYFGAHIPVVQEQDFPWVAQRLRKELRHAAANTWMYHIIVVGGTNLRDIDKPMLEAGRSFRAPRRPNTEIIVVAPSTISDETKQTLERRGLRIRLVAPPSRDHFR